MSLRQGPGRLVTVAVAALLGACLAAWLTSGWTGSGPDTARGTTVELPAAPESTASTAPVGGAPTARLASAGRRTPPDPSQVSIPSLGLRMPVSAEGVDPDGAMALPPTPFRVGWYRYGPHPLDPAGATVIAGHVDTAEDGAGPLADLSALRRGDLVEVRAGQRTVRYRVEEVLLVEKRGLDTASLFSRVGPARLHLVTCGGPYLPDAGGYQDNVVVIAERLTRPTDGRPDG